MRDIPKDMQNMIKITQNFIFFISIPQPSTWEKSDKTGGV
jgi:hypothetical protein